VGHDRRSTVARFLVAEPFVPGATVPLGRDDAHHIRVLRIDAGARVGLTTGAGLVGTGTLVGVSRSAASVEVEHVRHVPRPPAVHMLVPIADRERMLWLAEKCTELAATSWRLVEWRRSASVSPRGSAPAFQTRLRGRVISALTQSGGAWLPEVCEPVPLADAIGGTPPGTRIVLEPSGEPLLRLGSSGFGGTVSIAVGPEGGIEEAEHAQLADAGFVRASLGDTILRFETAGVAALAVVRAAMASDCAASAAAVLSPERADGE
jgi:16S rRNA (uracil1498-N3)-methyltransferase